MSAKARSPFPNDETVDRVLGSVAYGKKYGVIRDFMSRSRKSASDPSKLLELQVDMAQELISAREAQKHYEKKATESTDPRYRTAIAATKRVGHLVRIVADGIAWRALGYDRARLYVLASKPQTGALQSIDSEVEVASRHVRKGEIAIVNDLTNWLRYADVTVIEDAGPRMIEVKSGRSRAKGGRASKQWQKLGQVTDYLRGGIRETDDGTERIYNIQAAPASKAASLVDLFKRARANGHARGRLTESIAVDVFCMEAVRARPELFQQARNPFSQAGSLVAHSHEFFYTFTPHIAPYSVFPLPNDDCADLMTGAIWVVTYFSLHRFVRCLRRRGLNLRLPSRVEMKAFSRLPLSERSRRQSEMSMTLFKDTHMEGCSVSMADLSRFLYEFLDEESYADALLEVFDRVADRPERWLVAFEDEASLWD